MESANQHQACAARQPLALFPSTAYDQCRDCTRGQHHSAIKAMRSAVPSLFSIPASSSDHTWKGPKAHPRQTESKLVCRGLRELVEVELPRPKLTPEVSAAEEAAFRMTAMWMELPSGNQDAAAGGRPGELLATRKRP